MSRVKWKRLSPGSRVWAVVSGPIAALVLPAVLVGLAVLPMPAATSDASSLPPAAVEGQTLFAAQCAQCHGLEAPPQDLLELASSGGPSLHDAGRRLSSTWLETWLVDPKPVRPAGYLPHRFTVATADGDRLDVSKVSAHPKLTEAEAQAVTSFLEQRVEPIRPYPPAEPNAAIRAKVHFAKILPCGGCHRAAGAGGVSAPDLTGASSRLQAEWVRSFTWDPQAWGHPLMPKTRLRADQLLALTDYLMGDQGAGDQAAGDQAAGGQAALTADQILTDQEVQPAQEIFPEHARAGQIYQLLCSQCHGVQGNGQGLNAPHLFLSPRDHTSYDEMARLTDQRIYDAISLGGAAVGKSSLMPSWGAVLKEDDIWGLVAYLRDLSGTS